MRLVAAWRTESRRLSQGRAELVLESRWLVLYTAARLRRRALTRCGAAFAGLWGAVRTAGSDVARVAGS